MYHARHAQFADRTACERTPPPGQILIVIDDLTLVTCWDCAQIIRWRPGYVGTPRRLIKASA